MRLVSWSLVRWQEPAVLVRQEFCKGSNVPPSPHVLFYVSLQCRAEDIPPPLWIWAGLMMCTSQQNVAEVTRVCSAAVPIEALRVPAASLKHFWHHQKYAWSSLLGVKGHVEQTSLVSPSPLFPRCVSPATISKALDQPMAISNEWTINPHSCVLLSICDCQVNLWWQ